MDFLAKKWEITVEEFMVLHAPGVEVMTDFVVGHMPKIREIIFVKNAVRRALLLDTWLNIVAWSMQKHVPFLDTHQAIVEAG